MKRLTVVVAVFFAFFTHSLAAQAALGTFKYSVGYGDRRQHDGYVAILDLGSNAFVPVVTGPTTRCSPPNTTYGTRTADFANVNETFLAITANTGPAGGSGPCGIPHGLLVSNGYLVNWPQVNGPVLYFSSDSSATITDGPVTWLSLIRNAVAGSTSQDSDCPACMAGGVQLRQPGTLLVKNGAPGACVIPKATTEIAARGAIGLDATGRYLIVLVATGDDRTYGLYTPEFAELMIAFGGYNAVNFDGGGSTVFWWVPDFGYPASSCPRCTAMITGATLSNPTRSLTLTNIATKPMSTTILYTSTTGGRPVYASIGFRMKP